MAKTRHGPEFLWQLCAFLFAAFLSIGNAAATSANTDLSDIWWNPAESGWGMQIVNTGTFAFVTIYHYGIDGKPVWFGGGVNKTAADTFTGDLFATTGPYYGGPFNPAAVVVRKVGTMTFTVTSSTAGNFTYSVDGVVVSKPVARQPLTLDDYNGSYRGVLTQTASGCLDPAGDDPVTVALATDITQNANAITVVTSQPGSTVCTFNGTYSQLGRMGQIQSTYSCSNGDVGTAQFLEMNITPGMFTSRFLSQSSNRGCQAAGQIVGVIPQ